MSLPDPTPSRKSHPKSHRWMLFAPFIALALGVAVWSVFWVRLRDATEARLDADVQALADAGYPVTWKARNVSGYPFRMDITLTDVRAQAPGGWALQAPILEGEAYAHAITHWIMAAPKGLTFTRPKGGPVDVTAVNIRASLSHLDARPPSLSVEGVKLVFHPEPGSQPFGLASADHAEFHLRAGPDDEGGVFTNLDGGKAAPGTLLARVAGDKPVSMVWNATLSKMSAFTGRTWPEAVRHWSDAGGRMSVRQAGITAGDAILGAKDASLGVGSDARLAGSLNLNLRQAPRVLAALNAYGLIDTEAARAAAAIAEARQDAGGGADVTLYFEAGRMTFGPVAVGDAPLVYGPPR